MYAWYKMCYWTVLGNLHMMGGSCYIWDYLTWPPPLTSLWFISFPCSSSCCLHMDFVYYWFSSSTWFMRQHNFDVFFADCSFLLKFSVHLGLPLKDLWYVLYLSYCHKLRSNIAWMEPLFLLGRCSFKVDYEWDRKLLVLIYQEIIRKLYLNLKIA